MKDLSLEISSFKHQICKEIEPFIVSIILEHGELRKSTGNKTISSFDLSEESVYIQYGASSGWYEQLEEECILCEELDNFTVYNDSNRLLVVTDRNSYHLEDLTIEEIQKCYELFKNYLELAE